MIGLAIVGLLIYFIVTYWAGVLLIVLTFLLGYQAYKKGIGSKAGKWLTGGAAFFALAFLGWLNDDGSANSKQVKTAEVHTSSSTQESSKAKPPSAPDPAVVSSTQQPAKQAPATPARIKAKIIEAIDGDTIKVELNGKEQAVRFLLVDTPETKHPKYGEQPFGKEASNFTKPLVEGQAVELEQDVNNGPDKYGRLLYYVYVEGKSVQEQLLEKGLARVANVYVPNVKYVDKYREIQSKAQKAGVGIWSVENYAKEDGYHPEAVKKNGPGREIDTNKQVRPQQQKTTQQTKPEVQKQNISYKSCAEAKAAGAAPLHRGQPGYSEKLDRDKDGVACE